MSAEAATLFDVSENVAFVTGAASGLGFAIAEVLSRNGARVVLADIDSAGLATKTALLRDGGGAVESVVVDVGDAASVHAAIDAVVARHGRLDSVFANAGISGGPGVFSETGQLANLDVVAFERLMHVNVTGTLVTMQAAAAPMIERKRGRIVVTCSATGFKAEPMVAYSYSISKAALIHLVKHAAVELAQHGVLVSGIAPGPFRTNLGGGAILRNPEIVAMLTAGIPLRRLGEPDEVQGLALFLASPAASYMTGNVIAIDGGSGAC